MMDKKAVDGSAEHAPVKVRNRDIPLLADVLSIMQEVREIEERREWQHARMFSITQHITGMPGGGGPTKGLDDAFSMLSEIDEEHEKRCCEYVKKLRSAESILNGIEDHAMRAFVTMKYIMNAPDAEIQRELGITRRGFDLARKCVEDAPCMAAVKWRARYILKT